MRKVVLVTGASSGIGKSTAKILNKQGYIVYGAARRLEKMEDLKSEGVKVEHLDLTKEDSIVKCVNSILEKEKRIDVLINNAGYGYYGAIEDVSIEEAKRQFEVNLFGLARITQLVLPNMRELKSGRILNVSSMGGKVYTPLGAWYLATKHALEGWSDCLRLEVKEFGINVSIIEPGAINTPWGNIAVKNLRKASSKGYYAALADKVATKLETIYSDDSLTDVEVVGKTIAKATGAKKPKYRYVKGYMAQPSIVIRKWFGDKVFDKMIMSIFK